MNILLIIYLAWCHLVLVWVRVATSSSGSLLMTEFDHLLMYFKIVPSGLLILIMTFSAKTNKRVLFEDIVSAERQWF